MKANINLPQSNGLTKRTLLFLMFLIVLMCASCSKAQDTYELYDHIKSEAIGFRITFVAPNTVPERLANKRQGSLVPTHGVMTTDKGSYQFEIENAMDRGFTTSNIVLEAGDYFVSDISLYNADVEKIMYMEERPTDTTHGSEVVSWIGETFTFRNEDKFVLQVFYR